MEIPRHVAIILDGNGRWARSRGMPRNYGHVRGAANVENICRPVVCILIPHLYCVPHIQILNLLYLFLL